MIEAGTLALLYPILGVSLLLLVVIDLTWSTLSVAGGGPVTRLLSALLWKLSRHGRFSGPLILLGTAAAWIIMLWVGWTLVFLGAPDAVVSATSKSPADFWERLYFSGYNVATLGLGDYVPGSPLWRLLTVLSAASGLVLVTLGITYYTAVLQAVVQEQQFAVLVNALGDSPEAIVINAWDGESFAGLDSILPSLAALVAHHARRHYAYPVIHYFPATKASQSGAVQLARLAEALFLFRHVVHPDHRPPTASRSLTQGILTEHLRHVHPRFVRPSNSSPAMPATQALMASGIPCEDPAPHVSDEVDRQRRILLGYVRDQGFDWADVAPNSADPRTDSARPPPPV